MLEPLEELPRHESAVTSEMLEVLMPNSRAPSPAFTYFIAQQWEGRRGAVSQDFEQPRADHHADNQFGTKLGWLKMMKQHLSVPSKTRIWIWLDFVSVPTLDFAKHKSARASTLYYCQVCARTRALGASAIVKYLSRSCHTAMHTLYAAHS